ncbi:MAG: hypothetical protein H6Q74_47 [Firmicutes bacterium]|nr:hypothetical protein [Bacillota bacterium]
MGQRAIATNMVAMALCGAVARKNGACFIRE